MTTAPTCTEDGVETRTCSHCDATETRPVNALGHEWSDWTYNDAGATRSCNRQGCEATETVLWPTAVLTELSTDDPVTANEQSYQLARKVQFTFAEGYPTEDQLNVFGNWYCDYVIYADHYVAANSMGLYGAYGDLAQVLTSGDPIPANNQIILVNGVMKVDLRFKDIPAFVQKFTCGAFDVDYANAGTTLTIELRIWDEDNHSHTIQTMTHTFAAAPATIYETDTAEQLTAVINGTYLNTTTDATVTINGAAGSVTFNAAAKNTLKEQGNLTLTITKDNSSTETCVIYNVDLAGGTGNAVFTSATEDAFATVKLKVPEGFDVNGDKKVFIKHGNDVYECTVINNGFAEVTVPHFSQFYMTDGSPAIAQVDYSGDSYFYADLAYAISQAPAGATVTLLSDVTLTSTVVINKNLTLNLDSNNITATNARALWVKSGEVAITGNGTVSTTGCTTLDASSSVIRVGDSGNAAASLTIGQNVIVSTDYCYGVTVFGTNTNGVELVVNGTVAVTGQNGAISGNGNSSNKGKVTINVGATVTSAVDAAIYHPQNDTLTINGGTITGPTAVYVKSGTVAISGGTLNGNGAAAAYSYNGNGCNATGDALVVENCNYPGGAPTVTISGGTFTATNGGKGIAAYANESKGVTALPVVTATSNTISIPADEKWVAEGNGYKLVKKVYVAQIGANKYETLEAAFAAAGNNDTITLLADVALTERLFVNAGATPAFGGTNNRYATTTANNAITLDLNGHNITSSSNIALAGGSLDITGNGTISTSVPGLAPIEIRGTGDLTSKRTLTIGQNVTLTGSEYGLNVFGSNDAQKNTIDVTVNGTVNGILFVLGNLTNAENEINIVVNGTVDASTATGEEAVHTGIAINGNANVTVNSGATVTGESGIEVRAGSLKVNGGTITANAGEYSYAANGSGCTTKGAAIAVAQHGTALSVDVTLNGGTLDGVEMIGVTDVNNNMSNVNVTATQSFTQNSTIPEGYKWEVQPGGNYKLVEKDMVTVTFNLNGGTYTPDGGTATTGPVEVQVEKGTAVAALVPDPTQNGQTFDNWYRDDTTFAVPYDFDTPVTGDLTLYANWVAANGLAFSASLHLRDSVDINIFVNNVTTEIAMTCYVEYSTDGTNFTQAGFDTAHKVSSQDTKYRFDTVASFAANQLAQQVTFRVCKNSDDSEVKSITYSIKDYCDNVLANSSNANLKAVCGALMAYGYYAEQRFGGNGIDASDYTDYTDKVTGFSQTSLDDLNTYTASATYETPITGASASLDLKSWTELNIFFTGTANVNATVTVGTENWATDKVLVDKVNDTKCRVKIKGLPTVKLADQINVTVDGGTSVTYSPMAYIKGAVTYNTTDANVCKALYNYVMAAKTYFGNN